MTTTTCWVARKSSTHQNFTMWRVNYSQKRAPKVLCVMCVNSTNFIVVNYEQALFVSCWNFLFIFECVSHAIGRNSWWEEIRRGLRHSMSATFARNVRVRKRVRRELEKYLLNELFTMLLGVSSLRSFQVLWRAFRKWAFKAFLGKL